MLQHGMLIVPLWLGFPVHDLPGMAAQVIKTNLDSFSADRAVRGKTLGDKGSLAHFYGAQGRWDSKRACVGEKEERKQEIIWMLNEVNMCVCVSE